jgi:hypothetical protein
MEMEMVGLGLGWVGDARKEDNGADFDRGVVRVAPGFSERACTLCFGWDRTRLT